MLGFPKPVNPSRVVRRVFFQGVQLVVFAFLIESTALAVNESDTLVTSASKGRDALLVTSKISMTGTGYGTCTVTIDCSAGPSQSDRNLTVIFYPSVNDVNDGDFATRRNVQLAEGATTATVEIPILSGHYMYYDVGVFEDGSDIEDKRATVAMLRQGGITSYNYIYTNNGVPPFGFVVDSQALAEDYDEIVQANRLSRELLVNRNANNETSILLAANKLSADWRTYMRCTSWFFPASALAKIKQNRPDVAEAIVTYVASGGRIFVYDNDGVDALATTEALFPQKSFSWQVADEPPPPWWETLPTKLQQTPVVTYGGGSYGGYGAGGYGVAGYGGGSIPAVATTEKEDKPKRPSEFRGEINTRGVAFDAAIAAETWLAWKYLSPLQLTDDAMEVLGDEDYFDAPDLASASVKQSRAFLVKQLAEELYVRSDYLAGEVVVSRHSPFGIPREQLRRVLGPSLYGRHAQIAVGSDGNWFYRNLIAAVGKPPVWVFCFLITLFGAIIGPGLLFVTGRIGRRSLLILAVPLISLVATLAIITYGVLHEGFETHLRVNSVQWVEPDSKRGFAWSRQNYFSGLPPSGGLKFPRSSYLRAVGIGSSNVSAFPRRSIDGIISEDEQLVLSGWLRPRTQQQLLIGQPIEQAAAPIQVARAPSGLSITNPTNGILPVVVIRGFGADDYYFASDLAAGETRVVPVSIGSAVKAKVAKLMADLKPEAPPELRGGGGSLMEFGQSGGQWNSGEGDDVINQSYRRYMSDRMELANGGFSVVAEQSESVALPMDGKLDTGIHLILGELKW
ncbi:MAG: hypothetical protein Aurels2KO_19600 [Aureliella sp.]